MRSITFRFGYLPQLVDQPALRTSSLMNFSVCSAQSQRHFQYVLRRFRFLKGRLVKKLVLIAALRQKSLLCAR